MPKSRLRRKSVYTPPPTPGEKAARKYSPAWLAPVMLAMFIIGILWIVVFYLSTTSQYPIPALGRGNLLAGFAFILAGFGLSTQWR